LLQDIQKFRQALADEVGIAAGPNEVGVAIPARDYMYVQMVGQARTGAPAEVHPILKPCGFIARVSNF